MESRWYDPGVICTHCGLTNRPYYTECAICSNTLQDPNAASVHRREWEQLSPPLREEFEKDFERFRKTYDDQNEWLKRYRVLHGVTGAIVLTTCINIGFQGNVFQGTALDLVVGAAAALYLNRLRGGSYLGMFLFFGASILAIVGRFPFISIDAFWGGWFLFSAIAITFVAAFGYTMGLQMESDRIER